MEGLAPLADWTRKECLTTGMVMPTMSDSWNESVPMTAWDTWPVMTTSGTESMLAVAMPVTVLVAPGPLVTTTTPGRPVARA